MRKPLMTLLLALPLLAGILPVSAQEAQYEITNLIKAHDLENEQSGFGAFTITDEGVVVGFTGQSEIKSSPFVTVDGKPERLKTSGEYGATAGDVNSAGVVAGRHVTGRNEAGGFIGLPAIWVDGELTLLDVPLDALGQEAITGSTRAINEAGLIVGDVQYPGEDNQYVVVWQEGVPTILADAFGYPFCAAWGLTESGLIGGHCWDSASGQYLPVIWSGFAPSPAFAVPGESIEVTAITDTPGGFAMVGTSFADPAAPTDFNAAVVTESGAETLPEPAAYPACRAMTVSQTADGLLVGGLCAPDIDTALAGWAGQVAVAWLDGELIELNDAIPADSGWTLLLIRGVNSEGQMVGLGERNGERRSFILTPAN